MRCLVIGGNGFIGSHVVDELVRQGHTVSVLDRFSDGRQRYNALGVHRIVGDFLNAGDVSPALEGQEVVYHLLSTTYPASAEADPLLDVRTNITGSIELFKLAAASGTIQHLYFVSTGGAIYGEQPSAALTEDISPAPVSPYAIGKLAIEGYLRYFRKTHALNSTVLRLSNPYGPRQSATRKQGVIPIFLRNLASGAPITVYGDGTMMRDYIYVQDAARMIVTPLGRESSFDLYNVGSGTSYSLREIIDAIVSVTGVSPHIVTRAIPPTFIQRVSLDITRFESTFGRPTPFTALEEGIAHTWAEITS